MKPGEFSQAVREPDLRIIRRLLKLGLERNAWDLKEIAKIMDVSFSTAWLWSTTEETGRWLFLTKADLKLIKKYIHGTKLTAKEELEVEKLVNKFRKD